jgi:hypothetical protein
MSGRKNNFAGRPALEETSGIFSSCCSKRITGGTLTTVLALSIIMAAVSLAVISLVYYRNLLLLRVEAGQRLERNTRSGLNLMLASDRFPFGQVIEIDLYGIEEDTVALRKAPWGVFDLYAATARWKNLSSQVIALVGATPDQLGQAALYLADTNRPLSVSGQNMITGDSYLPKSGVKPGYLNSSGFQGANLIDGQVLSSEKGMPPEAPYYVQRVAGYCQPENPLANHPADIRATVGLRRRQSFMDTTLVFSATKDASLQQAALVGNIAVQAKGVLRVAATSRLQGVLLMGRKVIIQAGFKGNVQIFAQDTIIVQENVTLLYPSVLAVQNKASDGLIEVKSGTRVSGLIYLGARDTVLLRNRVHIAERAVVTGQVYVRGGVELKGTIYGNVQCNRFLLNTPTSLYENFLVNTTIDISKRSAAYVASPLLSKAKQKQIVQWLQ